MSDLSVGVDVLIMGSDTTATALTEIFVLLAAYPRYIDKIREEIDPHLRTGTFSCQTAYPVLDSFINETMRLYPPVLFGMYSQTQTHPSLEHLFKKK